MMLFMKDKNSLRQRKTNIYLVGNTFIAHSPLIIAFFKTEPIGNTFILYNSLPYQVLSLIVIPLCGFINLVILIYKIKFAFEKPGQ